MRRIARDRGFVLIVALGVLGVLGLLAATFATLSRVERSVSASYVDKVRARLLAQSGVERAIASIRGRAMVQSWDDSRNDWYYREMLTAASGGLSYPGAALAIWAPYVPARPYGMQPRSLEVALDDGIVNGTPGGISFPDTSNKSISGRFPGTYEVDGDVYGIKVLDCASMLNVNDGHIQIVRMLNALGSLLKCSDGTLVSTGGFQLGTQIQSRAVARGKPYNNKCEILDEVFIQNSFFAGKPDDARKRFDAVRNFITCHGWVDGMTPRFDKTWTGANDYVGGNYANATSGPAPLPAPPGGSADVEEAPAAKEPLEGVASPLYSISAPRPGTYASLPATSIYAAPAPGKAKDPAKGGGFKQYVTGQGTNKTLGGETSAGKMGGTYYFIEPRTPVNVNTASKEVLVACMMDLEADFWDYGTVNESSSPREYSANLTLRKVKISKANAEAAADHIISARYTFGTPAGAWTYNDWMHFEDEVLWTIPGLDRFQKTLIKANANPNANIRKLCPDLIMITSNPAVAPDELVRLDKGDIKVGSTDWTFASNGFFEIESIGRVYNQGRVMAEEKIETVVKVYDLVRYTTQEQFEQDRSWVADDSKEGDLLAGGYPPVVSMPEYVYNQPSNPVRYRSGTGDVSWCADYEGYLVLNGPAKVDAGTSPGPAMNPPSGYTYDARYKCAGPNPEPYTDPNSGSAVLLQPCAMSFVAGFNQASVYVSRNSAGAWQGHRAEWHDSTSSWGGSKGGPRHPEYGYSTPHCFADNGVMTGNPLHSFTQDTGYMSAYYNPTKPYQIEPTAAASGWSWGGSGGTGANFWDNGCDLQNFGIYINSLRRNRFHTYWADEVPAPAATVEMTVKPEIDLWNWATRSKMKSVTNSWSGYSYKVGPCSRLFLFDWVADPNKGMNFTIRIYVQLSRVYLELYHHPTQTFHVLTADHQWKPHTWHHVEASWVGEQSIMVNTGNPLDPKIELIKPPNAVLFVDGVPASNVLLGAVPKDTLGNDLFSFPALALPEDVASCVPNNDVGSGPRMCVGSKLQDDGSSYFGMTQPSWLGLIDNVVMHHWRSHDAAFTPRNRYHSVSYYDGTTFKSGSGYKLEKSGVYKKRLKYLESEASAKSVTIGTVGCTHYHPYHVHLYGHDGSVPTTSFGHITPALRIKTGGSYIDSYYYDGCVGVPVKSKVTPGSEIYYMGWFEVASLVPVTMSPLLCDFTITYFSEPVTYFRLSSAEAKR